MLGQGRDFVREPADSEHGRLVPQNSHLVGAGLPGSFMDQRWGGVRKQRKKTIQSLQMSPRMASLRQGDVLVLLPCSLSQVGGSGRPLCMFNNKKGLKSQKQFQHKFKINLSQLQN